MIRKSDLERDTSWISQAKCKGRTELFFGHPAEKPQARARRENAAATICAQCPVSSECRNYARDNNEYGFWGGESEESRHRGGHLNTSYMRFLVSKRDRSAAKKLEISETN